MKKRLTEHSITRVGLAIFLFVSGGPVVAVDKSHAKKGGSKMTVEKLNADFVSQLKDLIALEYDAIKAFDAAIERLEDQSKKDVLEGFKQDHLHRLQKISDFLRKRGEEPPLGPDAKGYLTKGKVVLADMVGDSMILKAVHSNELEVQAAYTRLVQPKGNVPEDLYPHLQQGVRDEERHLAWLKDHV